MVRTVWQTLLHSQLACNEMQASAQTCGRQHDRKCRLKSSQYTLIIPHRVIQLTTSTISFWVPETRLHKSQINKFPLKWVKNLATLSSIFISSSSTGELCSQPIRGNVRRIGWMFPEHVEPNIASSQFDEYSQQGSQREVHPIKINKNQLGSPNTSN